jgi:two-component system, NarL family, nitrate/nitrite response regulator NarL
MGARGETSLRRMKTRGIATTSVATAGRPYPLPAIARVLLVGDVRLFRELLEKAFAVEDGVEVVGSASCDVAAMAMGMFEPDVVVVDTASLTIPEGMHALATALPGAKIVGLGVPDDEEVVVALLEAGASGYVTAEQPLRDLVGAVEAASNGELPCPPKVSAALARRIAALAGDDKREPENGALTPRQREIASLIAEGLSNKQIARRLLIEQATVKNHVHSVLVKLGANRRDQVAQRLAAE